MKTLLTGIAGTGKSTIVKSLSGRGFIAIDLHDVPDLFFWQNKATKEKVEYTPGRPKEWFEDVDRICDIEKLKEILEQYGDVVVAGTTSGSNQREFLSCFDKIVLLQADPETLVHRMQTRTNKSGYGKSKGEQEDNIEWQKEYDPLLLSLGAIPIDTKGDLDDTVNSVIKILKTH